MQNYSHFFQTIYDEQQPLGVIGRGSHYSILRAVVFHDANGKRLREARFHDFAIIWDEDHDTRVIEAIEKIYRIGLLPRFTFIGERKAMLTTISSNNLGESEWVTEKELELICGDIANDCWTYSVGTLADSQHIIADCEAKTNLYLANIQMLWELGAKSMLSSWEHEGLNQDMIAA